MLSVLRKRAQISFAVTEKLICVFVFAYAIGRLSHDAAQMIRILSLLWLYAPDVQSSDNRYILIFIHTHRSSSPVVGSGLLSVRDLTSISVIYIT